MSDFSVQDCVPLTMAGDGCGFHRIALPFQQMGYVPPIQVVENIQSLIQNSKLVTWNRTMGKEIDDEVFNLRNILGYKVVIDIDDYLRIPSTHPLYQRWQEIGYADYSEEIIGKADAITCTTHRLAAKLREINPNVFVIPNSVPFEGIEGSQWKCEENKIYGGKPRKYYSKSGAIKTHPIVTRFAWSGGSTHFRDLKSIEKVFYEFPRLKFKLCGYNNPQEKIGYRNVWDDMEDITSVHKTNPNYKRANTLDLDSYMNHLNDVDVAIAPLEFIEWNGYKSSLKAYEAGVKKCAFICSKIPPYYDDLPRDIVTFCDNDDEWIQAFEDHMDLDYVKERAEKLYEWVKMYRNLKWVSGYRFQAYKAITEEIPSTEFPSYDQIINNHWNKTIPTIQPLEKAA